ncbi:alpha/beta fold hydrolase [Tateyamaria sp.]|uniref:alpha/beta fold hydrolase n=1 Tax=Tateyamaria sp. TaxID=1929288 RepID=UPI0032A11DD8
MTPLVLVHGFMGGSAQWDGQHSAFANGREVVAVDLPGFGKHSHLPPINSIEGFADWVIADLRTKGVAQYHLLGHSMGGMIAQEIARKDCARIERLVLYATGASGVLPGRFETIAQSKARAVADGARATARRIAATWFLDGKAAPGYEACAQIAEQASLDAIQAGLDAMEAWSGATTLKKIGAETLIIWGDRDRTYAWEQTERLWRDIPSTHLAVVPGCAHAVHLEKEDFFNALLAGFIEAGS